jgi:hypothetical protein
VTRYVEILALQRPFPYDVDGLRRTLFSCNYTALAAAPVTSWADEVVRLIELAGLGTYGSDIFIGPSLDAPAGDGPYVHVVDTGGIPPNETHNGDKYERLSVQIIVRAADALAGETRAVAIWRALDGRRNLTVAA